MKQTVAERDRLAITRRQAEHTLDRVAEDLSQFLDPDNDDFQCARELRADPTLQMILGDQLGQIQEALRLLRLQRQCWRCRVVLPMDQVQNNYCDKH
jgi:hypothetical protein